MATWVVLALTPQARGQGPAVEIEAACRLGQIAVVVFARCPKGTISDSAFRAVTGLAARLSVRNEARCDAGRSGGSAMFRRLAEAGGDAYACQFYGSMFDLTLVPTR